MQVRSDITSDLFQIKRNVDSAIEVNNQYNNVLKNITKIDFYARAFFEADESTCWMIRVYLDITGTDNEIRIVVETKTIYREPRFSYNEWKEQRESDRAEAKQQLELIAKKWGCRATPITE